MALPLPRRRPPSASALASLLLLVVVALAVGLAGAKCPRKCSCIWRDAKITVDCADKGLAGIPSNVDPSTQVRNSDWYEW